MKFEAWLGMIALAAIIIVIAYNANQPITLQGSTHQFANAPVEQANEQPPASPEGGVNREIILLLPAISQDRNGITNELHVKRVAGHGQVFLDASPNSPLIANETQYSMRTAVEVARQISVEANQQFQKSDLYFSFGNNALSVEGTSAGAAMTIATLALLLNLKLNQTVAITGSININGTIGPVGGVLQKANALKNSGYTLFIVPTGESTATSTSINEVQDCQDRQLKNGVFRVCTVRRETSTNSIPVNETGISVVEVEDIRQAAELMVQN